MSMSMSLSRSPALSFADRYLSRDRYAVLTEAQRMYIRTNMFQFAQFLLHQNEDHGTRTHTRTQCLDREL